MPCQATREKIRQKIKERKKNSSPLASVIKERKRKRG